MVIGTAGLTALCPGLPGWAGTRKVKPIWILLITEARDSEWQWHQLGHMQVCTSLQTDYYASTPPLSFLQARCPSCRPTNSVKALKAFTVRLTSKFATNSYLNIPPHPIYVATLPCEIWMSVNWRQCEICIVINDKSQDSTAKHWSYDGLLHYKLTYHLLCWWKNF